MTGAIIAGGSASRLGGRLKGLEIVGGQRIIDRVAAALANDVDSLVIAAGSLDATAWLSSSSRGAGAGAGAGAVGATGGRGGAAGAASHPTGGPSSPRPSRARVRIAPDILPVRASITGIHAAIAAADDDVIAIAWDMPFVSRALVAELKRRLTGGTSAVVPIVGGRAEPLCAAYSRQAASAIAAGVEGGAIRVSDVLARLPAVTWLEESEIRGFGDPEVLFFNVNTAADLGRAEAIAAAM